MNFPPVNASPSGAPRSKRSSRARRSTRRSCTRPLAGDCSCAALHRGAAAGVAATRATNASAVPDVHAARQRGAAARRAYWPTSAGGADALWLRARRSLCRSALRARNSRGRSSCSTTSDARRARDCGEPARRSSPFCAFALRSRSARHARAERTRAHVALRSRRSSGSRVLSSWPVRHTAHRGRWSRRSPYHEPAPMRPTSWRSRCRPAPSISSALLDGGLAPAEAARQIALRVAVGRDTFVELCKLRALRVVLAQDARRVRRDRRAAPTLVHAVCSSRTLAAARSVGEHAARHHAGVRGGRSAVRSW